MKNASDHAKILKNKVHVRAVTRARIRGTGRKGRAFLAQSDTIFGGERAEKLGKWAKVTNF